MARRKKSSLPVRKIARLLSVVVIVACFIILLMFAFGRLYHSLVISSMGFTNQHQEAAFHKLSRRMSAAVHSSNLGYWQTFWRQRKKKKQQVLIVSTYRSGASFLGELTSHFPPVFYHYEPLHYVIPFGTVENTEHFSRAIDLLDKLFNCRYDLLPSFLNDTYETWFPEYFYGSSYLRDNCEGSPPAQCIDPSILKPVCQMFPVQVVKSDRLRMRFAIHLLEKFPRLKVVYLVRDPRGTYNSRLKMEWCYFDPKCIEPSRFCPMLHQDLAMVNLLSKDFPSRFMAIKYEDLAINTEKVARSLFEFLGWSYEVVEEYMGRFIKEHTQAEEEDYDDLYDTYKKDSKKTALAWENTLTNRQLELMDKHCADVIRAYDALETMDASHSNTIIV